MKEFDFIDILKNNLSAGRAELGIGDDAALADGLLAAKDIMCENIHFTLNAPIEDIIMKLFTANVSDIASMGGTAKYGLLAVAMPDSRIDGAELAEAINKAALKYDLEIIGGDTTGSTKDLFLSLTVLGTPNKKVLKRDDASAGEDVYITRPLGMCRYYLSKELAGEKEFSHYRVEAETEIGQMLGETGLAESCIDISDGLGSEAGHLSDMSKVKVIIDADKLPTNKLSGLVGNPVEHALTSGEEFALLFTAKPENREKITEEFRKLNRETFIIGHTEKGSGAFLSDKDQLTPISKLGFEHKV